MARLVRLPSQRTAMLPTSRPANYSNSQDFRLAGGRRQILTKNIKLPALASRATRTGTSRASLDPHETSFPAIRDRRGDRRRWNTRPKFRPETMSWLPISLLSGDYRDTCAARCSAAQRGALRCCAARHDRNRVAHDRGTRLGGELVGT